MTGELCLGFLALGAIFLILGIVANVGLYALLIVGLCSALLILLPFDLLLYPIVEEKFPLIRYAIATWNSESHSNINEAIKAKKKEIWDKRTAKKALEERVWCNICGEAYYSIQAIEIHKMMRHAKEMEV